MRPNLRALEKWRDRLRLVGHPIRLSILIMLYGAEVLERQKVEEELKHGYPVGFLKYYVKMIRSALPVIETAGFAVFIYYLVIWPVKFFICIIIGKGIILPFSVKK